MLKTYLFAREAAADLQARLANLRNDDSGAAMIEYALLIGLVAVAGISALMALQGSLTTAFNTIGGKLSVIK